MRQIALRTAAPVAESRGRRAKFPAALGTYLGTGHLQTKGIDGAASDLLVSEHAKASEVQGEIVTLYGERCTDDGHVESTLKPDGGVVAKRVILAAQVTLKEGTAREQDEDEVGNSILCCGFCIRHEFSSLVDGL